MERAKIFENNRKWVAKKLKLDPNYFENLSKGQAPDVLYIGCSDSRVSIEELIGANPGDVFVYRNIANMIPNLDMGATAVIDYAVRFLKVKRIVVCGHYYCGGIKAAMEHQNLGILNTWLRTIRDVYRLHKDALNQIIDDEARYKRFVELNVEEQCLNVFKAASVQDAYREKSIEIYGWVFDIRSGKLIDLNIDLEALLEDVQKIYALNHD